MLLTKKQTSIRNSTVQGSTILKRKESTDIQKKLGVTKKYVFSNDSILCNYVVPKQNSKLVGLLRRQNGCTHRFSCIESFLRNSVTTIGFYMLSRPLLFKLAEPLKEKYIEGDIGWKQLLLIESIVCISLTLFQSRKCIWNSLTG